MSWKKKVSELNVATVVWVHDGLYKRHIKNVKVKSAPPTEMSEKIRELSLIKSDIFRRLEASNMKD